MYSALFTAIVCAIAGSAVTGSAAAVLGTRQDTCPALQICGNSGVVTFSLPGLQITSNPVVNAPDCPGDACTCVTATASSLDPKQLAVALFGAGALSGVLEQAIVSALTVSASGTVMMCAAAPPA